MKKVSAEQAGKRKNPGATFCMPHSYLSIQVACQKRAHYKKVFAGFKILVHFKTPSRLIHNTDFLPDKAPYQF